MSNIIVSKQFDISGLKNPQYIYELIDPRDNSVRYIGKTNNPRKRIVLHLSRAKKSTKTRKEAWMKGLLNEGLAPIMNIIKVCELEEVNTVEIATITEYKLIYNLYNMTPGGEGILMSKEIRAKVSAAKKGKPGPKASEETKRKMSLAQRGKKQPKWKSETFAKNCVKVVGINKETGIEVCFKSLKDAALFVSGGSTHILRCCRESKSYKNYDWNYICQ
jgi:group I intron endonuclease